MPRGPHFRSFRMRKCHSGAEHRVPNSQMTCFSQMTLFSTSSTSSIFNSLKKMPDTYQDIEVRIFNARLKHSSNPETHIAKLAEEFDVPYRRLLNRINGTSSKSEIGPSHKALTNKQEKALINILVRLNANGIDASLREVRSHANDLLSITYIDK